MRNLLVHDLGDLPRTLVVPDEAGGSRLLRRPYFSISFIAVSTVRDGRERDGDSDQTSGFHTFLLRPLTAGLFPDEVD